MGSSDDGSGRSRGDSSGSLGGVLTAGFTSCLLRHSVYPVHGTADCCPGIRLRYCDSDLVSY